MGRAQQLAVCGQLVSSYSPEMVHCNTSERFLRNFLSYGRCLVRAQCMARLLDTPALRRACSTRVPVTFLRYMITATAHGRQV